MSADQSSKAGPSRDETAPLPVLREDHLGEAELVDFSNNQLDREASDAVRRHLNVCPRCRELFAALHDDEGRGATKLSDPLLGRMLGEYRVEAALARGGMGAVYRGVQPMIGKRVAIKVLLPDMADDPDLMERLLEEARAVNAIRHPNIIDIFSFGDLPDGRHYFVMALLEGLPLNELQREVGRFTPAQVVTVLEQTMSALGAAHGAGVIHRDLKPANLIVTTLPDKSWHVTVLDFGLAKRLGSGSRTAPNMVMGTPGFMAPEQIRGGEVTERSDLYAMGVGAWVMLTGQEPFEAPGYVDLMMKHLQAPLPALQRLVPDAPSSLIRLVERLLEKQPEARWSSASEVAAELQRIKLELAGARPAAPDLAKSAGPRPSGADFEGRRQSVTPKPSAPRPAVAPRKPSVDRVPAVPAAPEVTARKRSVDRVPAVTTAETLADAPMVRADTVRTPTLGATRPGKRSLAPLLGVAALVLLAAAVAWFAFGRTGTSPTPRAVVAPVTPSEPSPTEHAPTEPTEPTEPKPSERNPSGTAPSGTAPSGTAPSGTAPSGTTPSKPTVAEPTPSANKPRPVQVVTAAIVKRRLAVARNAAARLTQPAARRMMNKDLDELEARLVAGVAPRLLLRDLDEVLENYGAR